MVRYFAKLEEEEAMYMQGWRDIPTIEWLQYTDDDDDDEYDDDGDDGDETYN